MDTQYRAMMTHGSDSIITIGDSLLERYPDTFSTDFEENGEYVRMLTNVESKRVQNRVAGYVTRQNCSRNQFSDSG